MKKILFITAIFTIVGLGQVNAQFFSTVMGLTKVGVSVYQAVNNDSEVSSAMTGTYETYKNGEKIIFKIESNGFYKFWTGESEQLKDKGMTKIDSDSYIIYFYSDYDGKVYKSRYSYNSSWSGSSELTLNGITFKD